MNLLLFIVFGWFLTEFIAKDRDQRPQYRGSLADNTITFHDVVMMDDPSEHERLLDEVRTTYDLAQGTCIDKASSSVYLLLYHGVCVS